MTNGLAVGYGTLFSYVIRRTDIGCTLTPAVAAWQNTHPDVGSFSRWGPLGLDLSPSSLNDSSVKHITHFKTCFFVTGPTT